MRNAGRFHLAGDVIDRVPKLREAAAHVRQTLRDKLVEHASCIVENGTDMLEVRNWRWSAD